jgi:hypothetical protein
MMVIFIDIDRVEQLQNFKVKKMRSYCFEATFPVHTQPKSRRTVRRAMHLT